MADKINWSDVPDYLTSMTKPLTGDEFRHLFLSEPKITHNTVTTQTKPDFVSAINETSVVSKRLATTIEEVTRAIERSFWAMPSVYPMTIEKTFLDHRGGTKSYDVIMVTAASGASLVIHKFGKTGQFGQLQIKTFETAALADQAVEKKINEKMGRGYVPSTSRQSSLSNSSINDMDELRKALGRPLFAKLGASNLRHLDPSVDTSGMREADEPHLDEDGKRIETSNEAQTRERAQRELELAKQREAEEAANAYKDHPLHGMF